MIKTTQTRSTHSLTDSLTDSLTGLRRFTLDFFTFLHADVQELDRKKNGPVRVALPAEVQEHFGQPEFTLVFDSRALDSESELVAYGSRLFDRMMTWLDQRSALTMQRLPSRYGSGDELMRAVRPINAAIAQLKLEEQQQNLFVYNWRITYRADDKREEMFTVVLDDYGNRVHTENGSATDDELIEGMLSDAEPVPLERNEDGQLIPARLPPMTHLTRLAETARKYAIYHADVRCVAHEADILPRLHKALTRLTNYYTQQSEEVYDAHDPDGTKRRILQLDLERKIAEEVENHRLRVDVQLISYAIIQIPTATAAILLRDGKQEVPVHVRLNRYTGALQRPTCHACGTETETVAIDRNGHVTCDDCLQQCAFCQGILCAECGVEPCPVCTRQSCATCGQTCWACGERACHEHLSSCPTCQDPVCHSCQVECAMCGVRQCRSHLRVDHILADQGKEALICASCAVRCPGCQQFSAQVDRCSTSGQRFCTDCLGICTSCGKTVGVGLFQINPADGLPYCLECLHECPTCRRLTAETLTCETCGDGCCGHCGGVCQLCGRTVCGDHGHAQPCGHVLCTDHIARCAIGREIVCAVCDVACGICERHFCADHAETCRRCEQSYCSECVRRSGLCDTCATIGQAGEPIDMLREPCAIEPGVAGLVSSYRWMRAGNARYTIYLGINAIMSGAVVVVDHAPSTPQVVAARKISTLNMVRSKLWG